MNPIEFVYHEFRKLEGIRLLGMKQSGTDYRCNNRPDAKRSFCDDAMNLGMPVTAVDKRESNNCKYGIHS
jgi:hypothetical protein